MNIILAIQLFLATLQTPITLQHQILIYGENFPMLFILSYDDDKTQMQLHTLPSDTLVPDNEHKQMLSLSTLQNKKEEATLKEVLSSYFQLPIENTIYVNTSALENDFNVPQPMKNITSFYDMQRYFVHISNQISFGDIFHIFDYVQSDLSLNKIYKLYKLYRDENFSLAYHFPFLIQSQKHWIPLSNAFFSTSY